MAGFETREGAKKYGEMPKDPYGILGVTPNNTKTEIKSAYRKLVYQFHPDRHPNDKEAADWFAALSEAYDFIINPIANLNKAGFFKGFVRPKQPYKPESKSKEDILKERQERMEKERREKEAEEARQAKEQEEAEKRKEKEENAKFDADQKSADDEADRRAEENRARMEEETLRREAEEENPKAETVDEPEAEETTETDAETEDGSENPEGDTEAEPEAETGAEDFETGLSSARATYVKEYIDWKNTNRKNKRAFTKIANDLGFERQMPEKSKPQTLVDAEATYMAAKKARNAEYLTGRSGLELGSDRRPLLNAALLEQVQEERELLQKQIVEADPPLEKGVLGKAFEKYAKLPKWQKIAISTALCTAGAFVVGNIGLAGAVTYAGARVGHSVLGGFVGTGTGKMVDSIFKKKNAKTEKGILGDYATGINAYNYEEKEKELMSAFESEDKKKKRQILYKGMAMAAAAGATTIGSGHAYNKLFGDTPTVGGGGHTDHLAGKGNGGVGEAPNAPSARQALEQKATEGGATPETLKSDVPHEASVELSPKGFIQDIENLKAKIAESYGGADKVPANIKENFLNQSSANLAQKLGFWDPEKGLSGVGLKGEHLGMDTHGNIVYEHAGGGDQVLMHADTGEMEGGFSGNMSGGQPLEAEPVSNPEPITDTEIIAPVSGTPGLYDMRIPHPPEVPTLPPHESMTTTFEDAHGVDLKTHDILYTQEEAPLYTPVSPLETPVSPIVHIAPEDFVTAKGSIVELDNGMGGLVAKVQNVSGVTGQIAHEHVVGGTKILSLEDKFQEGAQFKVIRESFGEMFDKRFANGLGDKVVSQQFESGQIHIVRGFDADPNNVKVFLNGKEIAKGLVTNKGLKIEMLKGLKPNGMVRWLLADNVYERALKAVNPILKSMKK